MTGWSATSSAPAKTSFGGDLFGFGGALFGGIAFGVDDVGEQPGPDARCAGADNPVTNALRHGGSEIRMAFHADVGGTNRSRR